MQSKAIKYLFVFAVAFWLSLSMGMLKAYSHQAVVPLSIKVNGKLVITDEHSELSGHSRNAVPCNISLDRRRNSFNITSAHRLKVRSNLNKWKLVGQIVELPTEYKKINSKNIILKYHTEVGPKANPNAAKLIAPFTAPVSISALSNNKDFVVLEGNSKTSIDKDPGNMNNWYGVNFSVEYNKSYNKKSDYLIVNSYKPKKYRRRQYRASINYTLVSI